MRVPSLPLRWTTVTAAVLVAFVLATPVLLPSGGVSASPTGPPGSGPRPGAVVGSSTPPAWSNGLVQVQFPGPGPSFVLTSVANSQVSTMQLLKGIAEVGPGGNTSAIASFDQANATWSFSHSERSGVTVVKATSTLSVNTAQGAWETPDVSGIGESESLGNASVTVAVFLNNSGSPSPDTVRFTVAVSAWPWLDANNDSLGLEMGLAAVGPTSIVSGPSANRVLEVANGTSQEVASLTWSTDANVTYTNGTHGSSTVATYQAIASDGSNSTVRLLFGSVGGGYTDLEYDPWVHLNLSVFPPARVPDWVFTPSTWIVLGSVVVVSLLLAAVAFRRRSKDSEQQPLA